jgi:hypothetical protein
MAALMSTSELSVNGKVNLASAVTVSCTAGFSTTIVHYMKQTNVKTISLNF